jgi:hypothetical protein
MYFCCKPIILVSCSDISFACLLFDANQTLFKSLQSNDLCLHPILPIRSVAHYNLRDRGHEPVFPDYKIFFASNILSYSSIVLNGMITILSNGLLSLNLIFFVLCSYSASKCILINVRLTSQIKIKRFLSLFSF